MKVAVCISGAFKTKAPNGCLVRNHDIIKSKFPDADFYYATWEQFRPVFEKTLPTHLCLYFPEPKPHYHPYTDLDITNHISPMYKDTVSWAKKGGKDRLEWTSHHTKQILIHAWLTNTIPNKYDAIVRTRFDAFISKQANFVPYIEDTIVNKRANCFGATRPNEFDRLFEVDKATYPLHQHWLLDPIIIHTPDVPSTVSVDSLYANKTLHAAEYGWYQVISMPQGSSHRNHSGWVNADVRVLDQFLWKITK